MLCVPLLFFLSYGVYSYSITLNKAFDFFRILLVPKANVLQRFLICQTNLVGIHQQYLEGNFVSIVPSNLERRNKVLGA